MEYFCHYCREWFDTDYCQSHFDSAHGQKNVTFEALQQRLASLGGLETREEAPKEEDEPRKVNWMFREKSPEENGMFQTNNFQHKL